MEINNSGKNHVTLVHYLLVVFFVFFDANVAAT